MIQEPVMLHNFHGGAKYLETEKQKKSGKSRLSSMNLPEMTKRKDLRKPQDLFLHVDLPKTRINSNVR